MTEQLIYRWAMAEEDLDCSCTVYKFEIWTLERGGRILKATGGIWICDYFEHSLRFESPDKWQAVSHDCGGTWDVEPVDSCFRNTKTGQQVFGLSSEVNAAMALFIAGKLAWFSSEWSSSDGRTPAIEELPVYSGPMEEYRGPCVCTTIFTSDVNAPFPWSELTHGNFPRNCFACSCGRKWWCFDPEGHRWAPVGDPATWTMLITYGGVEKERIVEHPITHDLHLLQAVREEGFVPISWPIS